LVKRAKGIAIKAPSKKFSPKTRRIEISRGALKNWAMSGAERKVIE